ncbi:nuclear transport factor 2 family protein [Aurantimonas endophytica]|uniref:Ketosteroid isomerase-like protein n=1 Tax=Aurantimonas endophytica TaxID=1522175 RepID=A0A7W6HEF6_9HYPH|nr:nuclear transport factor 2 family protein [Aurantimonas endophytica]MBB4003684.1 ketosteroid isomerase-like protein [Aurantimonas endophytica]MCO6404540.1 ketosteroid isomerase [Aurantimonas endophytica]
MRDNETIIRELYAVAEGDRLDMETFVSAFSDDGYMTDIPAGATLRGEAIGDYIGALTTAFPDIHRELFQIYVTGDVVVVELAIRGTHKGDLPLPSGTLAPTGRTIDVPCCDVFRLENGKVTAFHCYNAASVTQQQLGLAGT